MLMHLDPGKKIVGCITTTLEQVAICTNVVSICNFKEFSFCLNYGLLQMNKIDEDYTIEFSKKMQLKNNNTFSRATPNLCGYLLH